MLSDFDPEDFTDAVKRSAPAHFESGPEQEVPDPDAVVRALHHPLILIARRMSQGNPTFVAADTPPEDRLVRCLHATLLALRRRLHIDVSALTTPEAERPFFIISLSRNGATDEPADDETAQPIDDEEGEPADAELDVSELRPEEDD